MKQFLAFIFLFGLGREALTDALPRDLSEALRLPGETLELESAKFVVGPEKILSCDHILKRFDRRINFVLDAGLVLESALGNSEDYKSFGESLNRQWLYSLANWNQTLANSVLSLKFSKGVQTPVAASFWLVLRPWDFEVSQTGDFINVPTNFIVSENAFVGTVDVSLIDICLGKTMEYFALSDCPRADSESLFGWHLCKSAQRFSLDLTPLSQKLKAPHKTEKRRRP